MLKVLAGADVGGSTGANLLVVVAVVVVGLPVREPWIEEGWEG